MGSQQHYEFGVSTGYFLAGYQPLQHASCRRIHGGGLASQRLVLETSHDGRIGHNLGSKLVGQRNLHGIKPSEVGPASRAGLCGHQMPFHDSWKNRARAGSPDPAEMADRQVSLHGLMLTSRVSYVRGRETSAVKILILHKSLLGVIFLQSKIGRNMPNRENGHGLSVASNSGTDAAGRVGHAVVEMGCE